MWCQGGLRSVNSRKPWGSHVHCCPLLRPHPLTETHYSPTHHSCHGQKYEACHNQQNMTVTWNMLASLATFGWYKHNVCHAVWTLTCAHTNQLCSLYFQSALTFMVRPEALTVIPDELEESDDVGIAKPLNLMLYEVIHIAQCIQKTVCEIWPYPGQPHTWPQTHNIITWPGLVVMQCSNNLDSI